MSALQFFDFFQGIFTVGFSLQFPAAVAAPVITKTTTRTPVVISRIRSHSGCCRLWCLCHSFDCLYFSLPTCWLFAEEPKEGQQILFSVYQRLAIWKPVNSSMITVDLWDPSCKNVNLFLLSISIRRSTFAYSMHILLIDAYQFIHIKGTTSMRLCKT